MRILQVGDARSVHIQRWSEALSAQGHDVHVASFRHADIPGATVHLLPTWGLGKVGYLFCIRGLRRLADRLSPDVIHAQYVTSYGFICAFAGIRPLVVTAWGTDVLLTAKQSKLGKCLVGFALRRADAVSTVAEHMNRHIADLGVVRSDVVSIPFGVDTDLFQARARSPGLAFPVKVISTRNLAEIYDVGTIVRAVHLLVKEGLPLSVTLAGEGPERSLLETLVKELDLGSVVRFVGRIEHKKLPEALGDSDIFISSAVSDGNNISLNEAMACGVFPIATDIPANTQWIEDGINGFVYPGRDAKALADRVRKAIQDPELRMRAASLNREIVEQRANWQVCVRRMVDLYTRVALFRTGGT